eukprot:5056600-Pleurochrysis_carterae.AAC.1
MRHVGGVGQHGVDISSASAGECTEPSPPPPSKSSIQPDGHLAGSVQEPAQPVSRSERQGCERGSKAELAAAAAVHSKPRRAHAASLSAVWGTTRA